MGGGADTLFSPLHPLPTCHGPWQEHPQRPQTWAGRVYSPGTGQLNPALGPGPPLGGGFYRSAQPLPTGGRNHQGPGRGLCVCACVQGCVWGASQPPGCLGCFWGTGSPIGISAGPQAGVGHPVLTAAFRGTPCPTSSARIGVCRGWGLCPLSQTARGAETHLCLGPFPPPLPRMHLGVSSCLLLHLLLVG